MKKRQLQNKKRSVGEGVFKGARAYGRGRLILGPKNDRDNISCGYSLVLEEFQPLDELLRFRKPDLQLRSFWSSLFGLQAHEKSDARKRNV